MKAPRGSITQKQGKALAEKHPEHPIFLVGGNSDGCKIESGLAKDLYFNCAPPDYYYFTNYWFAYAHSLKIRNGKDVL